MRLDFLFKNNNFKHVVECPCGLVIKCKCISLYQLQYCNTACVLDYYRRPYCIRRVDGTILLLYIIINFCCDVLKMFLFYFCRHGD